METRDIGFGAELAGSAIKRAVLLYAGEVGDCSPETAAVIAMETGRAISSVSASGNFDPFHGYPPESADLLGQCLGFCVAKGLLEDAGNAARDAANAFVSRHPGIAEPKVAALMERFARAGEEMLEKVESQDPSGIADIGPHAGKPARPGPKV